MNGRLLDQIYETDHAVITAELSLRNGRFLQPTGFPDIGACVYHDKDGKLWCLVESEQSMANRLEAVCMRNPGVWVDELKNLPLIAVQNRADSLLATNLTEPHRIASSYLLDGELRTNSSLKNLKSRIESKIGLPPSGDSWPLDKRADLDKLVFALDPSALLHGFQFVQWEFVGLRQTRLLHARLEAELPDDPEVHYGMVKWDAIEPKSTREERANKGQSIAVKSRIVPKRTVADFEIDVLGLKNLALDEEQKKLLLGLALWKVGAFLKNRPAFDPRSRQTMPSLRLRADCYMECGRVEWRGREGHGGRNGNQTHSSTTPEDLMEAMPKAEERPNFAKLMKELLPEEVVLEFGFNKLYEGPCVLVTYRPTQRRKAEKSTQKVDEGSSEESQEDQ